MTRTTPAGTPLGDSFHVFDTTLRDGAQREGITYSVADKLAVARLLDELGVGFIEGGWPGAMPKDTEFFARAAAGELELRHAALVAFGSTRRAGTTAGAGPAGAGAAGLAGAGRHAGRQVRPPAHRAGAAHRRRRGVRDGRATPSRSCAARAGGCSWTRSTSSTATPSTRTARCGSSPPRSRRARTSSCSATPTGDSCRWLAETVGEVVARTGFRLGIHCQDDTGLRGGQQRRRGAGGRDATCSAPPTATASGPATPTCSRWSATSSTKLDMPVIPAGSVPNCPGSRMHSPRSRTSHPTPTRPTSGRRPSPTRRVCTRARSRWIRCCTTTSIPPSSATTCGCW